MIRTGSSKSSSELARTKNTAVARASGAWVLRWLWRYSPMPLPRRVPFGCRRGLGSRRSRGSIWKRAGSIRPWGACCGWPVVKPYCSCTCSAHVFMNGRRRSSMSERW